MSGNRPLVSVIIDNYNYSQFLHDCVKSVLNQTYENIEIIIVDDGSTDGSRDIIASLAAENGNIRAIYKENGGQASAFNAGFAESRGEIICFLDSDDLFSPEKAERIAEYHMKGYDYIYTDMQGIDGSGNRIEDGLKRFHYDGHCLFPVYYLSKYPGNISSTISVTRGFGKKIFPLPYEESWRIQADDCIVFQAGMMTRTKYLGKKLTLYRLHGANGYYGKKLTVDYIYNLLKNRNILKDYVTEKTKIGRTFLENSYNLIAEFSTHGYVDYDLLKIYLRIVWYEMRIGLLSKIQTTSALIKIYNKQKNMRTE